MRGAREYIFFGQLIERNRAFSSIYAQHLRFFELLEIDRELALPDERRDALSRAYGNFDKVVMMGWLIGDVVLGRKIDRADAHAVGRKAGKLGPTLKAEFGAPSRCVGKRKWQSEEDRARADAEASAKESRLRRERVSLPFPKAAPSVPLDRKSVV